MSKNMIIPTPYYYMPLINPYFLPINLLHTRIPTVDEQIEYYKNELAGPKFNFTDEEIFCISIAKDSGLANLQSVYQNTLFFMGTLGFNRNNMAKIGAKPHAGNIFNAIKESFKELTAMGFTVDHIAKMVTRNSDRLQTILSHAKYLLEFGFSHDQIVSISCYRGGNKTLKAISQHRDSLTALKLTPNHVFQLSACMNGSKNIKIITIYKQEFIKYRFSADMILNLQKFSYKKIISHDLIQCVFRHHACLELEFKPFFQSSQVLLGSTNISTESKIISESQDDSLEFGPLSPITHVHELSLDDDPYLNKYLIEESDTLELENKSIPKDFSLLPDLCEPPLLPFPQVPNNLTLSLKANNQTESSNILGKRKSITKKVSNNGSLKKSKRSRVNLSNPELNYSISLFNHANYYKTNKKVARSETQLPILSLRGA